SSSSTVIKMAIVYKADNSITIYRNDVLYSAYTKGALQTYPGGSDTNVMFGRRHGTADPGNRALTGRIEEARVYDGALTASEIAALTPIDCDDGDPCTLDDYDSLASSCTHDAPSCTCSSGTCAPVPPNMVSWYPMEGSVADRLGTNNPSASANVSFVAGKVGQAVSPDAGGYIDVADSPSLQLQQISIAAWVRPDGPGPNLDGSIIVVKNSNANDVSVGMGWNPQTNGLGFVVGTTGAGADNVFPPGSFYHVVGTYDGANVRFYRNGELQASTPLVTTISYNSSVPWVIGANNPEARGIGFPRTFNGVIDEVEIFDRALSGCEVAAMYAADSRGTCTCGNGIVESGEDCEDGNTNDGDGCDNNCTFTGCGNGVTTSGEQCDDANTSNGDCCSGACQFETLGAACADEGNACTIDACNATGTCVHTAGNTGAVCRPVNGSCDVAESCNGSATCPADGFADASVVCRTASGGCDLEDHCSGSSAVCADAKSTAPCRNAVGDCDAAESCDGVGNDCPADQLQPTTQVCRASVGACDAPDYCTGTDLDCPADAKSNSVCRPPAWMCDLAETCDGVSDTCPADGFVSNGTSCNDGNLCTSGDQCSGGSCAGSSVPDGTSCTDDNTCTTADQCSSGVCGGASRPNGAPCDDGNTCTTFDFCLVGFCVSNSPLDGPSCNDGNSCTTGDHCVNGSCDAAALRPDGTSCVSANDCVSGGQCAAGICDSTPRPNGTPCNDHNFC